MSLKEISADDGYEVSIQAMLASAGRTADDRSVALVAGLAGVVGCAAYCGLDCACAEAVLLDDRLQMAHALLDRQGQQLPSMGRLGVSRAMRRVPEVAKDPFAVRAMVLWMSDLLRPPYEFRCRWAGLTTAATGLDAYVLWLHDLERCVRLSAGRRMGLERRARSWTELRMLGARFCRLLAGARRTRWAECLREAARFMDREIASLNEVPAALHRKRALAEIVGAVERACTEAQSWCPLICDAALSLAGIEEPLRSELGAMEHAEPDRTSLKDLVYLARAGAEPFRVLALRRLAWSDDHQAQATVRESCHDANPRVALTGQWGVRVATGQLDH